MRRAHRAHARREDRAVSLLENIRIPFEALWNNRLRSFLALLGIVIGVFAVTALVSLGQMATAGITSDLESVANRMIIVEPNYNLDLNMKRLSDVDVQALSHLPVTVVPEVVSSAEYEKKPGDRRSFSLYGTYGDLPRSMPAAKIASGRFFSTAEAQSALAVAVLNPPAVKEMFNGQNPIGKPLRLYFPGGGRLEVLVVGVTESQNFGFGSEPPQVTVPITLLWRVHPEVRRNQYDVAFLHVKGNLDLQAVQKQAETILSARHGKDTLRFFTAESLVSTLGSITLILQALLGAIAGLSLLVGGIGIMNIMLVSVTERTREIGLRKALGATSGQIRGQFLAEAMVLTFVGGLFGVLLAAGMLWLVVATVPFFKVFVLSPTTIAIALSVSVLVGLFFGVWPAARRQSSIRSNHEVRVRGRGRILFVFLGTTDYADYTDSWFHLGTILVFKRRF